MSDPKEQMGVSSALSWRKKNPKNITDDHLFLRDQMFVYMLVELLFHLYLYRTKKEQKKKLHVVKDEIQRSIERLQVPQEKRIEMHKKIELETGGAAKIQPVF